MTEIIEIIYAYLVKENYKGTLSVTSEDAYQRNCTGDEFYLACDMIADAGFLGLYNVDRVKGVSPSLEKSDPDYSIRSIAYMPAKNGSKAMLRVNTLRESLRDYSTRGPKELSDGLVFDEPPEGFYVVDMFDQKYAEDIPLTPDSSPDKDNVSEMKVNETDGGMLEPRSFADIGSSLINSGDLGGLNISIVAGILSKISEAKKAGRTLFLVYEPGQIGIMESYIRCALKFMSPKLANSISFITCYGEKTKDVGDYDICGIPTTDDGYVKGLGGIVFRPLQEVPDLGVYSVLENIDLDDWADVLGRKDSITDIAGLETALSLMTWGDEDDAYIKATKAIALILNDYELLTRLFDDPVEHLGLAEDLEVTIGILDSLDVNDYYNDIVVPLARIVEKESGTDSDNGLLELLLKSVIGLGSPDNLPLHHKLVADRWDSISKWIDGNIETVKRMVVEHSDEIGDFLVSFFTSTEYEGASLNIGRSFLDSMLKTDVECIRRMDVLFKLMVDRDQFVDVIKIAFDIDCDWDLKMSCITGLLRDEYGLVEQEMVDIRVWDGMFDKFIAEVRNRGKTDDVATYYAGKTNETDGFIMMLIDRLMNSYIDALAQYSKPKDICIGFQRASLFAERMTQFKNKARCYEIYLRKMSPEYKAVIDGSKVRDLKGLTDDLEMIVRAIGDTRFDSYDIPDRADFVSRLKALLTKLENVHEVSDVENVLSTSRIEFVLNEVELLGAGASNRLIRRYCGTNIHRQSDVRKIVEDFLRGDADPESKRAFCMDVSAERKRVKTSYALKDYALRTVYGLIFAVCMTALVFAGGYAANHYFSNGYFSSVYYVAAAVTFVVSLVLYIDSYRLKGTHNVLLRALVQTLVLIAVAFVLYILIQQLLLNILN